MKKNNIEYNTTPLRAAFSKLRAEGIVARMNFACCQSCGLAELPQEEANKNGYVFYHHQDAERLKNKGEVWLAWGIAGTGKNKQEKFGRRVCDILEGAGLRIFWNGDASRRIEVVLPVKED